MAARRLRLAVLDSMAIATIMAVTATTMGSCSLGETKRCRTSAQAKVCITQTGSHLYRPTASALKPGTTLTAYVVLRDSLEQAPPDALKVAVDATGHLPEAQSVESVAGGATINIIATSASGATIRMGFNY